MAKRDLLCHKPTLKILSAYSHKIPKCSYRKRVGGNYRRDQDLEVKTESWLIESESRSASIGICTGLLCNIFLSRLTTTKIKSWLIPFYQTNLSKHLIRTRGRLTTIKIKLPSSVEIPLQNLSINLFSKSAGRWWQGSSRSWWRFSNR